MFFVRLILDLIYLTSDYQPNFFIILLALKDTLSLFLAVALQVISQPLHYLQHTICALEKKEALFTCCRNIWIHF